MGWPFASFLKERRAGTGALPAPASPPPEHDLVGQRKREQRVLGVGEVLAREVRADADVRVVDRDDARSRVAREPAAQVFRVHVVGRAVVARPFCGALLVHLRHDVPAADHAREACVGIRDDQAAALFRLRRAFEGVLVELAQDPSRQRHGRKRIVDSHPSAAPTSASAPTRMRVTRGSSARASTATCSRPTSTR